MLITYSQMFSQIPQPMDVDALANVNSDGLLLWALLTAGAVVLFLIGMFAHENINPHSPLPFLGGMAVATVAVIGFCIAAAQTFDRIPTMGTVLVMTIGVLVFAGIAAASVQAQFPGSRFGWWVFGLLSAFAVLSTFDEVTSRLASGTGLSQGVVVVLVILITVGVVSKQRRY